MMTIEYYKRFKAYAMQYGTFVGLVWIASFACVIAGFSMPLLGNLSTLLGLGSLFLACFLEVRFRRNCSDNVLSFGRAYWFALLMFFYASLLMAISQFVYFRFLDNGFFVSSFEKALKMPGMDTALQPLEQSFGMSMEQMLDVAYGVTPAEITFNVLAMNMMLGLLLALPVALLSMRGKRRGEDVAGGQAATPV